MARTRASWMKYNHSPKRLACQKRYQASAKGRATIRRYEGTFGRKLLKHLTVTSTRARLHNRLRMQETRCLLPQ